LPPKHKSQSVHGVTISLILKCFSIFQIREDSTAKTISELTRVSGIGPAKAKELIDQGILSINELRDHEDLLTHHQIIGLRYVQIWRGVQVINI
jgi:Uncharacterized conserved protein